MRTYQRPRPPSLWVPGMTVIPSVAGEHGPGGLSPTEAVTGLHRAPRVVGCLRPRGSPTSGASVATALPPCGVRAAAGASCARPLSWAKHMRHLRRLARARNHLEPPQPPHRPQLRPPRQRLVAADRRPSGGLNACGARQAGTPVLGADRHSTSGELGRACLTSSARVMPTATGRSRAPSSIRPCLHWDWTCPRRILTSSSARGTRARTALPRTQSPLTVCVHMHPS